MCVVILSGSFPLKEPGTPELLLLWVRSLRVAALVLSDPFQHTSPANLVYSLMACPLTALGPMSRSSCVIYVNLELTVRRLLQMGSRGKVFLDSTSLLALGSCHSYAKR